MIGLLVAMTVGFVWLVVVALETALAIIALLWSAVDAFLGPPRALLAMAVLALLGALEP